MPQPEVLARATILLPYSQVALELRELLRETSPQKALLLPQIYCLDDIDPLMGAQAREETALVYPLERLGILTDLILKHQQEEASHRGIPPQPFIAALKLAESLASLLDQAAIERVDLNQLKDLVGEELAHHWQIT